MSLQLQGALADTDQALEKVKKERDKVVAAEIERDEEKKRSAEHWRGLSRQAAGEIGTQRVGQRVNAMRAIKQAAAIYVEPELRRLHQELEIIAIA